jgi:hypothetical protein
MFYLFHVHIFHTWVHVVLVLCDIAFAIVLCFDLCYLMCVHVCAHAYAHVHVRDVYYHMLHILYDSQVYVAT